ncbi:MAG: formylglycine-generating enzyme family protein [Chloroflexi bacterium]|nr:formylglycine-generating enzyme family protein [Chloroflexota bacterium]
MLSGSAVGLSLPRFSVSAKKSATPLYLPLIEQLSPAPAPLSQVEIYIEAGNFQMGCDDTIPLESCQRDELPLHRIYLDAYWIDQYEITNAQYAGCVESGSCAPPVFPYTRTRTDYYGASEYGDYPVTYLTWYQARQYCSWTGKRLPTEAEWEKAARGIKTTRAYPWGDFEPDCTLLNYNFCQGDTAAAGSYPAGASQYGVMDMAGNVWEWVNDWYSEGYYAVSPEANPAGPASGTHKVIRGGSWFHDGGAARLAYRFEFEPGRFTSFGLGFRCARSE